jgi:hypothetical protein
MSVPTSPISATSGGPYPAMSSTTSPIKYSSSIHGNAAQLHHTPRFEITPHASGLSIKPNSALDSDWAHFSIPTPITVDGKSLHVVSVWLRYANGRAGKLRDVRLHDGEHEIAAWGPHPFTSHGEVMTEVSLSFPFRNRPVLMWIYRSCTWLARRSRFSTGSA